MEAQEMRQQLELAKQQRIIEKQQQQLLQQQIQEQSKDIATLSMNAVKASHDKNEDEYWSLFEENFDLIHQKFFRHLREQYPNLTSTDLKFCALLRLNLSTKDIARFTGLTIRGVEGARFRLRKKLNIPEGEGLTEFLIDFK
ncbi:MAG: helix-turn-helix transcriptional regulator [Hoylesella buccalis]